MATKKVVGRPPKYKSKEEIEEKIEEYFKECEGEILKDDEGKPIFNKFGSPVVINQRPPTVTGLALALGFSTRLSLLNYQGKKEFMNTITRAKARVEAYAEERIYERVYIGGDYGQQNATTFEAFGLDLYRKKFPGLGEYYHSGRDSGRQKSPSEYARDLVEFMDMLHEQYENRIFYIFLDPSAKGLAEEVKRATRTGLDYQVLLRDAENDVALGISRVQKALSFEVMSIDPSQENADREFGTYEYDKKSIERGKEVPVKMDDHCMDAIRYAVMGAWSRIKHWLPIDEGGDER